LNIQTEHLENHTARLTVEVDPQRLEQAKSVAARKIAKQVEIPGFRKGKAPQHLVLRYVGEARILEDAIDELGQTIYRETLDQADVKPYGPGSLEDVKVEPNLTFVYTVPLQPSIELGDYRNVRVEYIPPTVTDADVERALKSLQDQEGTAEDSTEPIVAGDRITVDIHSFFVEEHDDDEDEEVESDEAEDVVEADVMDEDEADDTDEVDADHDHEHTGDPYIHEHDLVMVLREGKDDEPIGPGFVAAMLGANVGDTREFVLTFPSKEEEPEISDEVAGKQVEFVVSVKKIEKVTLPEINDEFAAKFTDRFGDDLPVIDEGSDAEVAVDESGTVVAEATTEGETESAETAPARPQLTLEQLREKIREELLNQAINSVDQGYSDGVLDQIVKGATVSFPEMMVNEQLDSMVETLDQRLRQQGITLDMYQSLTGKTREDVRNDYREQAVEMLKRSLVLFEIAVAEKLQVTPDDFEQYIQDTMSRLGFASPEFRKTFENPSVRENILNRILQDKTFERIKAIGKGEAPELPASEEVQTSDVGTETPQGES
jgi:trigger factor